jgi:hypothetical protein
VQQVVDLDQRLVPGRFHDCLMDGTVELDIRQLLVAPKVLDHPVVRGP